MGIQHQYDYSTNLSSAAPPFPGSFKRSILNTDPLANPARWPHLSGLNI